MIFIRFEGKKLTVMFILFMRKCKCQLRGIFTALEYPERLIESTIIDFISSKASSNDQGSTNIQDIRKPTTTIRNTLPVKNLRSADLTRRQLKHLSNRIDFALQPVSRTNKIGDALRVREYVKSTSTAWFTIFNVVCVIQTMSVTPNNVHLSPDNNIDKVQPINAGYGKLLKVSAPAE